MDLKKARVLVTGGNGFLGRHVLHCLVKSEAHRAFCAPRAASCDLRDPHAVGRLFAEARPDIVIHLAAKVGGILANKRHPGTFFHDNMLMGLNVLDEAKRQRTAKVVIAGTICAYPKFTPVPFSEDDLWSGYPEETNAPYGVAKKALLVMAQAYRQEFGCNFVTCFPTNLYGPGDHFDLENSHVIPGMVRRFEEARLSNAEDVTLWGDGTPTREFLFVEDAAAGIVAAAERYDSPEPVNIGSGEEVSIATLAEMIKKETGFCGQVRWDTSRPNGQPRRAVNSDRARRAFGFEAKTTLTEGIADTVSFYRREREAILCQEMG